MYLPKTLRILRKFGRAQLSGRDFIELCFLNKIEIVLASDIKRGFYYYADGRHTIALSTSLSRAERQFVGWHEFAHFLQNFYLCETAAAFSDVQPNSAEEKLADVFALIAVRPNNIRITRPLEFLQMIMLD